jgi:intraflagellar transport protein 81
MQLSESEALLRQLREQQRNAKEHHAYGLTQIDMMSDLIGLLQVKQQLQASYAQCGQMGGVGSSGGRQLGSAGGMMPGVGGRGLGGQSYNTNVMVL